MFYSYSVTVLGMLLSGAAAAPGAPWIFPGFAKWSTPEIAPGSSTLINAIRDSSVKAGPLLPLTKEKVELMALAAELTQAVYYQGNTKCDADNDPEGPDCDAFNPGYEALGYNALYSAEIESHELTVLISDDNVDANLFMDIGDYCFVTWRATISFDFTDMTTVKDWFYRNFDFNGRDVTPIGETTTCSVQEGIYEAYQGGEGARADLEDDIIRFVEGCMDGKPNKQLVLTGHSQGAGAAMMGALRFANRNPLTIALAGPPILQSGEECPVINRDHIWRVVNTENNEDNTELMYDLVRRHDIASCIIVITAVVSYTKTNNIMYLHRFRMLDSLKAVGLVGCLIWLEHTLGRPSTCLRIVPSNNLVVTPCPLAH